jgi:hypothetical protein
MLFPLKAVPSVVDVSVVMLVKSPARTMATTRGVVVSATLAVPGVEV